MWLEVVLPLRLALVHWVPFSSFPNEKRLSIVGKTGGAYDWEELEADKILMISVTVVAYPKYDITIRPEILGWWTDDPRIKHASRYYRSLSGSALSVQHPDHALSAAHQHPLPVSAKVHFCHLSPRAEVTRTTWSHTHMDAPPF